MGPVHKQPSVACLFRGKASCLSWTIVCQLLVSGSPLLQCSGGRWADFGSRSPISSLLLKTTTSAASSSAAAAEASWSPSGDGTTAENERNSRFVDGLLNHLMEGLDKYIMSGSPLSKERVFNILEEVEANAQDPELIQKAHRMIRRAGLALPNSTSKRKELGRTDDRERRAKANERKKWEATRTAEAKQPAATQVSRSALGQRQPKADVPDVLFGRVDSRLRDPAAVSADKEALESAIQGQKGDLPSRDPDKHVARKAATKVSEIVAKAGAGRAFEGETLGIGGLDDVLSQVKRRVWVPLAAPPQLLEELGINPVRGLLLYGRPGCGKTLLARKLGQLLSPMRPITVVSGPEILDKFVGSSEKNLREIFDNPPDIFDFYRVGQPDNGGTLANAALHVIIMDEFDAIARSRGGRGGSGDQGDAGVARDSVVNQLLAKMDGVDPLVVPTLVVGLTNKRSLIEPALLRAGRFEVQVEVPPPRTVEQRISILKVHTNHMQKAGRLFVRDAPANTPASRRAQLLDDLCTYDELLLDLADDCAGFSGASIAAVCRAAASHALERAVEEFTFDATDSSLLADCVVTRSDFDEALKDVIASQGDSDWADDEDDGGPSSIVESPQAPEP